MARSRLIVPPIGLVARGLRWLRGALISMLLSVIKRMPDVALFPHEYLTDALKSTDA